MKKISLFFVSLVFIYLFAGLLGSKESLGAENDDHIIAESYFTKDYSGYKYPILPKMSTWPYGNHQSMVNVCQIPETVLNSMSTEQLVETVMAYPLLCDVISYESKKIGYETIKEHFNGLQALSIRDDRNECLEAYIISHDKTGDSETSMSKYYNLCISTLLASDDFNITFERQTTPSSRATRTTFANNVNVFVYYSNQSSISTPQGGSMYGYASVAMEYWNYSDGTKGWYFPPSGEFGTDARDFINNYYYTTYGLSPVDSSTPSAKYNCHSYAWYSQTAHNYWVEEFNSYGHTPVILQSANIDGKAVYYNSYGNNITDPNDNYSHSALIQSKIYHPVHYNTVINLNLRSKWGGAGIYAHTIENCPYYYVSETHPCDMMYYNS